jgi:DNA polymerase
LLLLTGITNLRGKWVDYNGIPCMPTYHPSYVQRKEHMEEGKQIKEDFISDIKTVAEKAGFIK